VFWYITIKPVSTTVQLYNQNNLYCIPNNNIGIKIAARTNISISKKFDDDISFFLVNSENKKNDKRGKNKKSNWLRNHINVCILASTAIHKIILLTNKKKNAIVKENNILKIYSYHQNAKL